MTSIPRRTFLHTSLAAVTTTLTAEAQTGSSTTAPAAGALPPLIDVNIHLHRCPFRRLALDDSAAMAAHLRANGVTQAWCGSFDALLHNDLTAVNTRLTEDCQKHGAGLLVPVGSINPMLPGWRHDLARCIREHRMKAIRLHPGYHGYKLDAPAFLELLKTATSEKLIVQIVAQMEDQRTHHPLVQVPPVDLKPLAAALDTVPQARLIILNANRAMSMTALQGLPVWIDIAMLEGVGGLENLLKDWPADKVLFGSHAPFFYWEAARLKLQESHLTASQLAALTHANIPT